MRVGCSSWRQPFVVCDRVLDDQRLDPVRMRQCHPKADGASVVLHVQGVVLKTERLRKVSDDVREVVKRVRKRLRVRPLAVTKPRIIRRDQVIPIGQARKQRLEHP
jgi:hypothetical protein